ncbi:MAG TPA: hypothetical protein VKU36_06050 [Candidatus Babeliales bacterium]|nr:hypothetical protein [Candidatus Babeliales bacterium]
MKKCIFMACMLAVSSMNAMQDQKSFFSLALDSVTSLVNDWFKVPELSVVQKACVSRDSFEKQLKMEFVCSKSFFCANMFKDITKMHEACLSRARLEISPLHISCCPDAFLRYCYYQKLHDEKHNKLFDILEDKHTHLDEYNKKVKNRIKGCLAARIDDYSAVGAAMIAQHRTFKQRRIFIKELFKYGFKPTLKDIQLAELLLHSAITRKGHTEVFIHLLHDKSDAFWKVLPAEIKQLTAQFLRELYKKNYWLLPEL